MFCTLLSICHVLIFLCALYISYGDINVLIYFPTNMSNVNSILQIRNKFRGGLLGVLAGDCLGAPWEGDTISKGDKMVIQKYFDTMENSSLHGPYKKYTDDTSMTKSLCTALVTNANKNNPNYVQMARLFSEGYYREPHRGYGQAVVDVFRKLRKLLSDGDEVDVNEIFVPAQEQFGGTGSFGNGGAMRVTPIALHYYDDLDKMLEVAAQSTKITHSNDLAINGALLHCLAIRLALTHNPSTNSINKEDFLSELKTGMAQIESSIKHQEDKIFSNKLDAIRDLMQHNDVVDEEFDEKVIMRLGNGIAAHESVATAIFCFLKALNPIPSVQANNIFRRTIQFAIGFGGDTDTIASMAGAIAGTYVGESEINKNLISHCERFEDIISLADDLLAVSHLNDEQDTKIIISDK